MKSDPLAPRDERRLSRHVSREIRGHVGAIVESGFDRVIGTSGTILSLGTMAAHEAFGEAPGELRNLRLPAKVIHRLRKRIVELNMQQRLKLEGLEPKRVDIVVAGAVLLDTILQKLGADELTLCDLALREGLILDYVQRNRRQIAQIDRYPDVRRRSVIELAERCNYSAEHAQQVARLAMALFDQTRAVHGLADRAREWLEYAALMHDLGIHISYERHHRHSYYLIKNGDLRGFDPQEVEVIALVARYHRRAAPKKAHGEYADLPSDLRKSVKVLSALLRLAEGLDRSHSQALSSLSVHDRGDDYLVNLRANGDAELELWAAGRHVTPLERVLRKPVRFEVSGNGSHAEHAHDTARVPRKAPRRRGHRRVRKDDAAQPAR